MSDTNSNRPINPESVASKLAAIRNFDQPAVAEEFAAQPRFVEAILFLQWVSQPDNYAGGLRRFAADLIVASGDLIGTAETRRSAQGIRPAIKDVIVMYQSLPERAKRAIDYSGHLIETLEAIANNDSENELAVNLQKAIELRDEEWAEVIRDCQKSRALERAENEEWIHEKIASEKWGVFQSHYLCAAEDKLSSFLRELCELPHVSPVAHAPWYFEKVGEALLRFMDVRKAALAVTIAETEISREIMKWLRTARNTSRAIMISGNCRFGKTEALRTWCAMHPGLARLVNTPSSNLESDLLREVAKALGIETGPTCRGSQLRDRIDYVLTNTRVMLVFDEAQMLFPVNFTRNTAPARLNWVRRSVMDAGLPCAFCRTPQDYNSVRARYVKTTGYVLAQFEERVLKTIELPEKLNTSDLLAVAQIHFPRLDSKYLAYVVETVSSTERNFMSDLEKIATLARHNAQESGRATPILSDIKAAISDVLPKAQSAGAAPRIASDTTNQAVRLPHVRKGNADALQRPFPSRGNNAERDESAAAEDSRSRINFDSETAGLIPASAD